MSKEKVFIISAAVTGAVLAVIVVGILAAVAVPSYNNYIMTQELKASTDYMNEKLSFVVNNTLLFLSLIVPFLTVTFMCFLKIINPAITFDTFKFSPSKYKASLVILILLASYTFLFVFRAGSGELFINFELAKIVTVVIVNALMWELAGFMGWAGDFTMWGGDECLDRATITNVLLLGALVGAIASGVFIFASWTFDWYMVLVSEVLDGSSESSVRGFAYILCGLAVILSVSFAVVAGTVSALAPVGRKTTDRLMMLRVPLAIFAVFSVFVMSFYGYAYSKYDLGKGSLASVLGVPDKATQSISVMAFSPQSWIELWPFEIDVYGTLTTHKVSVSVETLEKAREYINSHPDGSVYYYSLLNLLWQGPFVLWDLEAGSRAMSEYAGELYLPALMIASRASHAQITESNLKGLEALTDKDKWSIAGKYNLVMAEGFAHFGQFDRASHWQQRAIDEGVEIESPLEFGDPVLSDGIIRGKVQINGKSLSGIKVALLSEYDSNMPTAYTLMKGLIATEFTDNEGAFAFKRLGSGSYAIALVTDSKTLPTDIRYDRLKVKNSPSEKIDLSPSSGHADLGLIEIEF